jgi:hypothetical protein
MRLSFFSDSRGEAGQWAGESRAVFKWYIHNICIKNKAIKRVSLLGKQRHVHVTDIENGNIFT